MTLEDTLEIISKLAERQNINWRDVARLEEAKYILQNTYERNESPNKPR